MEVSHPLVNLHDMGRLVMVKVSLAIPSLFDGVVCLEEW